MNETSLFSGLGDSLLSGLSATGDFLKSDQGANILKGGAGLYGAYSANQLGKDQLGIQNQQLLMQQDAYNRNVKADEARQNLNF